EPIDVEGYEADGRVVVSLPPLVERQPIGESGEDIAAAPRDLHVPSFELCLDTRQGHGKIDWLGDVVVRTELHGQRHRLAFVLGAHHDDGQRVGRVLLADDFEHGGPTHAGHVDVEQNELKGAVGNGA